MCQAHLVIWVLSVGFDADSAMQIRPRFDQKQVVLPAGGEVCIGLWGTFEWWVVKYGGWWYFLYEECT